MLALGDDARSVPIRPRHRPRMQRLGYERAPRFRRGHVGLQPVHAELEYDGGLDQRRVRAPCT